MSWHTLALHRRLPIISHSPSCFSLLLDREFRPPPPPGSAYSSTSAAAPDRGVWSIDQAVLAFAESLPPVTADSGGPALPHAHGGVDVGTADELRSMVQQRPTVPGVVAAMEQYQQQHPRTPVHPHSNLERKQQAQVQRQLAHLRTVKQGSPGAAAAAAAAATPEARRHSVGGRMQQSALPSFTATTSPPSPTKAYVRAAAC